MLKPRVNVIEEDKKNKQTTQATDTLENGQKVHLARVYGTMMTVRYRTGPRAMIFIGGKSLWAGMGWRGQHNKGRVKVGRSQRLLHSSRKMSSPGRCYFL